MSLALLVLALFLAGAAAMITRVLPALIALPVMGVAIASGAVVLTGEIGWLDVLDGVVSGGAATHSTSGSRAAGGARDAVSGGATNADAARLQKERRIECIQ